MVVSVDKHSCKLAKCVSSEEFLQRHFVAGSYVISKTLEALGGHL